MRRLLLCLVTCLLLQPALASSHKHHTPNHAASESQLLEHGNYRNADGVQVHRPAHSKNGSTPEGASAKCRDGSFSFSQHHRGTCSRHGGVAQWLD